MNLANHFGDTLLVCAANRASTRPRSRSTFTSVLVYNITIRNKVESLVVMKQFQNPLNATKILYICIYLPTYMCNWLFKKKNICFVVALLLCFCFVSSPLTAACAPSDSQLQPAKSPWDGVSSEAESKLVGTNL